VQSNQYDSVMGAGDEMTAVREVEVLRDKSAAFQLSLRPKFGIVATREIFLLGRMNIVSKLRQTSCNLQREVLVELGFQGRLGTLGTA
jgi:hypothetical protein